ncbi:MAG: XkdX family protein, partial [Anaerotignum sp.]|nr:XkdX family protein [Anaerotignum sp.]
MSADFAKLKRYFVDGLWTKKQIGDAVSKGWITAEEYREITGEDYVSMPTQLDAIQAAVEKSNEELRQEGADALTMELLEGVLKHV